MTKYIELEATLAKIDPDEYYHSNEVKDILLDVPAADVAPVRHGRWEFVNDYECRCTYCHEESYIDHTDEPDYCPKCGAKMDETPHKEE